MQLSSPQFVLFVLAATLVACAGAEESVVRALKGDGREKAPKDSGVKKGGKKGSSPDLEEGGQGESNTGAARSKKGAKGHHKSKSSKGTSAPTVSSPPTLFVKCKSSKGGKSTSKGKGKTSKGKSEASVAASSGPFPDRCAFVPAPTHTAKSKAKQSHGSGDTASFLDGILGYAPQTTVVLFPTTDRTRCLQATADGADVVLDTCRFDDASTFTIDRYGRFHTQGWGRCLVADAAGTDIVPGPCGDCGAVFSYDAERSRIRLYEDPATVLSYRGTDVFLAEEILDAACLSSDSVLRRLDDGPLGQSWEIVAIDNFALPTASPAPSSALRSDTDPFPTSPINFGAALPASAPEQRVILTSAPTFAPTVSPTSTPTVAPVQLPTSAPAKRFILSFAPTFDPTFAPTASSLEDILDYTIGAASSLYMHDPVQGGATFGDIEFWDTSRITSIYGLFDKTLAITAKLFNEDIGRWDTSRVFFASYLFNGAEAFDQDIGWWDTSSIIYAQNMFQGATRFNQDLSYWDTTKIENFFAMFQGARAFNQDLSSWSFDAAEYVQGMFWDSGIDVPQCFDLSGRGLDGACGIFQGAAGGDAQFCEVGLC